VEARVELIEQVTGGAHAGKTLASESLEVDAERGYSGKPAAPGVLTRHFECFRIEPVSERDERRLHPGHA
jgi:hypothetical protein